MYLSMNDLALIITAMEAEHDATVDMSKDETGAEKETLTRQANEEQVILNSLQEEYNNYAKSKFVCLDPDQQVHYLNVLADYHGLILTHLARDEYQLFTKKEFQSVLDTMYMLGNIEGRMIHNHTMQSDLDMLEEWETELLINKEDAE